MPGTSSASMSEPVESPRYRPFWGGAVISRMHFRWYAVEGDVAPESVGGGGCARWPLGAAGAFRSIVIAADSMIRVTFAASGD